MAGRQDRMCHIAGPHSGGVASDQAVTIEWRDSVTSDSDAAGGVT